MAETFDWSPTHPQAEALREHFNALYLLDSTCFDCSESLQDLFPSCGGDGSAANVKVLLRYELIAGRLEPLEVMAGKRSDQGQALRAAEGLREGCLQLQDKGFYDAKAWEAATQRGAYLLMPLPHSVTLWTRTRDQAQEQSLDLAAAAQSHLRQPRGVARNLRGNSQASDGFLALGRLSTEPRKRRPASAGVA